MTCVTWQGGAQPRMHLPAVLRGGARWQVFLRELLMLGSLFLVYNGGRVVAARSTTRAFGHAQRLWAAERWLHLPSEAHLQSLVIGSTDLIKAANAYYASVHFPLTGAVLIWLFLRSPEHYLWARRSIVGVTTIALACYVLLPMAPPRMFPGRGFVDTGLRYGQSVYGAPGKASLSDQFAAMPSLHVGWAVLVAVVLISAGTSRWRWLWTVHPAVTLFVVVVTANHYWADAAVGAALAVGALLLFRQGTPAVPASRSGAGPEPALLGAERS